MCESCEKSARSGVGSIGNEERKGRISDEVSSMRCVGFDSKVRIMECEGKTVITMSKLGGQTQS